MARQIGAVVVHDLDQQQDHQRRGQQLPFQRGTSRSAVAAGSDHAEIFGVVGEILGQQHAAAAGKAPWIHEQRVLGKGAGGGRARGVVIEVRKIAIRTGAGGVAIRDDGLGRGFFLE